jgi:predicted RNA binding protein YcfA (HicA-like mRNA interferase family)
MISPQLLQQLRNTPVRDLIAALERDGFTYRRLKGSGRVYRHLDGRRVVVHYHHSGDTLPIGTLRNIFRGTGWTEADLRRLRLLT